MLIGWMAPAQNIDTEPELIIVFDKNKIIPVGEAFPELLPEIQKVEQFGKTIKQQGKNPEDEDLTKYMHMQKEIYNKVSQLTNSFNTDILNRLWQDGQKSILPKDAVVNIANHTLFSTMQDIGQHSNNLARYIEITNKYDKNRQLQPEQVKGIVEIQSSPRNDNKYKNRFYKYAIGINTNPPEQINIGGKIIKLTSEEIKKETGKTYTHTFIGKNDRTQILFDYVKGIIYKTCYKDNKLVKNDIVIYYKDIMNIMGFKDIESVKDLFEKLYVVYTVKYPYIKLLAPNGKYIMTKIFGQFVFDKDSILIHIGDGGNTKSDLQTNLWGNIDFNTIGLKQEYLKLKIKDYLLVKYIKEIIRDDKTTTKKTISYRSIYNKLNLPETTNNKRTKQTIKEPLRKAITGLDTTLDDNDYYVCPKESTDKNIEKWLDKSFLIVMPNDADRERNKEIKAKQKKHLNKKKPTNKKKVVAKV